MNDKQHQSDARSNRSTLKRATVAATGLAVGAGITAGTTVAQDEDEVVIPGQYYYPDVDFEIVAQFDSSTRDDILAEYDDVFDDTDDWDAYATEIEVGGSANVFGFLFAEEDDVDISTGDSGTFEDTASFRNAERNLIEVDPEL